MSCFHEHPDEKKPIVDTLDSTLSDATTGDPVEVDEAPAEDVRHFNPYDRSAANLWLFEDPRQAGAVLTQDGISQIAHHEYKAGKYTVLDNLLNPFWAQCTEFLPMTMAPNMVTTIGGATLLCAYLTTWYYIPHFEERPDGPSVPEWLLLLNGMATMLYFTFDCMDGKQARRTGTSSPLGQLFDHGMDCMGNLAHISSTQSYLLLGPSKFLFWAQAALHFSFFVAQWEEYYTGILPHSMGNWVGVTEVNYGLAVGTMLNIFIDRQAVYTQTVQDLLGKIGLSVSLLRDDSSKFDEIFNTVLRWQAKHLFIAGWVSMVTVLVLGSFVRVFQYERQHGNMRRYLVAMSKLISPLILVVLVLFVLPTEVIQHEARFIGLAFGLCYCFITIKLIVLSMARMAFASIQLDIVPFVLVVAFVTYEYEYAGYRRLKPLGVKLLFQVLTVHYLIRLLSWVHVAVQQLCARLDIYLFSIKPKSDKKKQQ